MSTGMTAEGIAIPVQRRKLFGRQGAGTALLLLPMVGFLVIFFLTPLGMMISRSAYDPTSGEALPETRMALKNWNPEQGVPGEPILAVFSRELVRSLGDRSIGRVGSRMNDRISGAPQLLRRTAVAFQKGTELPPSKVLASVSPDWGEVGTWSVLKDSLISLTPDKYLAAVDVVRAPTGELTAAEGGAFINLRILWRTMWVSAVICVSCLILAYPITYLMTQVSPRVASVCMIAVLIPYWTSALVRTTGWIVLLQREGVLNKALVALGIIRDDQRLALIFNMTGTLIVMVHVLLPIMVLPLYSSMLAVPKSYQRAAISLGAHPFYAFWSVFVPLTRPGIAAGITLVFMLSVGFYVTPALVGGAQGTFIGNVIAFHMDTSLNWGLAAAMSTILFVLVLLIYIFYSKKIAQGGKMFG